MLAWGPPMTMEAPKKGSFNGEKTFANVGFANFCVSQWDLNGRNEVFRGL